MNVGFLVTLLLAAAGSEPAPDLGANLPDLLSASLRHVTCFVGTAGFTTNVVHIDIDRVTNACTGNAEILRYHERAVPHVGQMYPFMEDPFVIDLLHRILPQRTAYVETGTAFGDGLMFVGVNFPHLPLYSCEFLQAHYEIARKHVSTLTSIAELALEGTETFLPRILPKLAREAPFVFIDAHGGTPDAPLPLQGEMQDLGQALHQSDAFVLVHDFRHPLQPGSRKHDDGVELLALRHLFVAVRKWCLFLPNYSREQTRWRVPDPVLRPFVGFALIGIGPACDFKAPIYLSRIDHPSPLAVLAAKDIHAECASHPAIYVFLDGAVARRRGGVRLLAVLDSEETAVELQPDVAVQQLFFDPASLFVEGERVATVVLELDETGSEKKRTHVKRISWTNYMTDQLRSFLEAAADSNRDPHSDSDGMSDACEDDELNADGSSCARNQLDPVAGSTYSRMLAFAGHRV